MIRRLVIVFVGFIGTAQAQPFNEIDSVSGTFVDQMNVVFQNVDLSEVENGNGILYDYGFPLLDINRYDGINSDSNYTDMMLFSLAYATIFNMALDDQYRLPLPASYRSICDTVNSASDVIPVPIIFQEYFQISETALSDNLFSISANQLYDIPGRPFSPYLTKELFLAAPAVSVIKSNSLSLVFRSDLYFNNTSKIISGLWIDFDNGFGFVPATMDVPLNTIYDTGGERHIRFKVSYSDGTTYFSHSVVNVSVPASKAYSAVTPDITHHINVTTTFTIPSGSITKSGGGTVYVSLACGHTTIQKPFIWAEGFNPVVGGLNLGLSYSDAVERIDFIDDNLAMSLSGYLEQEGYDLIVLDYDNGGDYMEVTAKFIEEAIKWINLQKNAAGSHEKNVIIGQSMGGMCARYAIRTMEIAGIDHQIATYIMFDSGQEGVNIPLGAQYCLQHLAHAELNGELPLWTFVQKIEDALALANLPAARAMIKYQHEWSNSLHDHYYHKQNNILGVPQNCEVLSIANGSRMGNAGTHNFSNGELVVHFKANSFGLLNGFGGWVEDSPGSVTLTGVALNFMAIWPLGLHAHSNIRIWALSHFPFDEEKIYHGKLTAYVLFVIPVVFANRTEKRDGLPGIDAAPGGFVGHGPIDLSGVPAFLAPDVFKLNTFCFTPTVSTLNYYGPSGTGDGFLTPYKNFISSTIELQSNSTKDVDNFISNSIVQNYGLSENYKNTGHTFFTSESAPFMIYHLVGEDLLNGVNSLPAEEIFNFGKGGLHYTTNYSVSSPRKTSGILSHSLLVSNFSKLTVNGSTRIGFHFTSTYTAPNQLPFTNPISNFTVQIKNKCEETAPISVRVDHHAQLVLGDGLGRIGDLQVYSGHSLIIGNEGVLKIEKGSELVLKSGSKLVLESGSNVINRGKIRIESGATLIYYDGANISMPDDAAEIQFAGGNLLMKENSIFTFTGGGGQSGHLRFSSPGEHIFGENNTRFLLQGNGNHDPLIILDDNAVFLAESAGIVWIGIHSGKIIFNENSKLVSMPNYFSNNTHYVGLESNHGLITYDNSTITNAIFDEVPIYAPLFYKASGTFNLVNSEINNTTASSIVRVKGMGYSIFGCEFNGSAYYMFSGQNTTQFSTITNTKFNGSLSTVGVIDNSAAEVEIKKCEFNTLYAGVHKLNGKINLKCNSFVNFKYAGAIAHGNCLMDMSSLSHGGYNTFVKNGPDFGFNIALWNAQYIYLGFGYNKFDAQGNLPIIQGTIAILPGILASPVLQASRNQWNAINTPPLPSDINVTSYISGLPLNLITANPQSVECPPDGIVIGSEVASLAPPGINGAAKVNTLHFNDVKLVDAMDQIITESERYDDLKNDLIALELFDEVLTHDFTDKNQATNWLIDYGSEYMKHTLQHTFRTGKICRADNMSCFHPGVQNYVNVLNKLTSENLTVNNYEKMFYWEMDKVHLFHQLGRYDLALLLLYNMESCGLDSTEQRHVNHWKYELELEFAKINYGYGAESIDSNWVDTTNYIQPVNQSFGNFGSEIVNQNTIIFYNCSNPKSPLLNSSETLYFSVYPNPTSGIANVTYELTEGSEGYVMFYSIDGKELKRINCPAGKRSEVIDLSTVEAGIYLYTYVVDGIEINSGKLIVQ